MTTAPSPTPPPTSSPSATPGRGPRPARGRDEALPAFWTDLARPRLARAAHPRGVRRVRASACPSWSSVVEELGRAIAPGPFVPDRDRQRRAGRARAGGAASSGCCPAWPTASTVGAVALGGDVERARRHGVHGSAGVVLGGGLADVLLVAAGDDVAVIDVRAGGVDGRDAAEPRPDPAVPRASRSTAPPAEVIPGARQVLRRPAPGSLFAAEAVGIARECTELAAEYAKVREQFGRPIAMFQAVKHHCANMLVATELATAAVWDAARAAGDRRRPAVVHRGHRRHAGDAGRRPVRATSTSRCTAASASPGSTTRTCTCAGRRRSTRSLDAERGRDDVTDLVRARRAPRAIGRPAARGRADPRRGARVRRRASRDLDAAAQRTALIESGYVDAALAQAVGPRRRRGRAARHRAGVRGGRRQAARVRHHRLGHPHADPARHRRPGRALGAARRSTRT